MAATNKTDLQQISRQEYDKLSELLGRVGDRLATTKDDDVSIKDVVGHRAYWIELFLGWYADGLAGKPVFFPAEGYKWNDLKRFNADLRAKQAALSWPDAKAMLNANFDRLMAFIDGCSDAELYGGPMQGANNQWTPGRWAEAAGPSHFRSAAKYIRSRLKAAG